MKQHLEHFDPLVSGWFSSAFRAPTEPQILGWPEIRAGRDALICAPTGSGKTLASFLICLDSLVREARSGALPDATQVIYVSPLKALSNDVRKNLEIPLSGIRELAEREGVELQEIRTAVRTGDTTAWERQKMLEHPPHVLVTTPESLFILLTAAKSRAMLTTARTIIVDEIHAVADDKRGSHLALSLARLEALVQSSGHGRPQRIGLSATVNPIEDVANFLTSGLTNRLSSGPTKRLANGSSGEPVIINIGHRREMDLGVEVPRDELGAVASNDQWGEIYDRLAELIRLHRTTLVFVNTRRVAERVAHHLGERLGENAVLPHHGSLSRALRLKAEERLKRGELRAIVATASLELGIDIGSVELVCQLASPRSIAVAWQRIGRSGHWVGACPKGRLFATTRDDLIECGALVRAIRAGDLDRIEIPHAPLDILSQQIVAEVSAQEWREDDLFELYRASYSYSNLSRQQFDEVVEMLSEGISTRRGRGSAYLHRDRVNGVLRARRGARLAAMTSGGAIPETGAYQVVVEPTGTVVGTVDEDFASECNQGDVFLLGTTSWRIRRVEPGRVRVENAGGSLPYVPFWRGEAPPRTDELSAAFSALRGEIAERINTGGREPALQFLMSECGMDRRGAEEAADYVTAGMRALGVVPTQQAVVAERFFDEAGGMQLVLHAPFGMRLNRAWALALRKRFCRTFNFELQAAASDNGIIISLSDQHSFPLELVFRFLREQNVEDILTQAMLPAPFFASRWRWNATRSLAVLRFNGGRKVPAPIQRMRSDDLLAAVFPDQVACAENLEGEIRIPDHPLVNETIGDCLHEAMDLDGLKRLLQRIEDGTIRTMARDTAEPTPFSHEIVNSNPYTWLDDAPLEERRARAVQMRRTLSPEDFGDAAALDADAIRQVAEQSWPAVRDADELHDALLTLITLPAPSHSAPEAVTSESPSLSYCAAEEWQTWFEELKDQRRATLLSADGRSFWVAAEETELARNLHPDARFEPVLEPLPGSRPVSEDRAECAATMLRGWFESTGPTTAGALAASLALPQDVVDAALARLEGEGQILRGHFIPRPAGQADPASAETEWCNRRILSRIHRMTLGRLRSEIQPVSSAEFMRFLVAWHHLAPGSQLHGADGLFHIIRQLQGYELPAGAWESQVLARRVAGYKPEYLDQLCFAGEVMWGRLSPHPAFEFEETATSEDGHKTRRVRPSRVAPVALFLREDAPWLASVARRSAPDRSLEHGAENAGQQPGSPLPLSHAAREIAAQLERRGALFFAEIVRATGRLPSEVEDGLWELVAAGLVTADGFENLRALSDPKRRRGENRFRNSRPRHAAGRWALMTPEKLHVDAGHTDQQAAAGLPPEDVEKFARLLLVRWGVIFRDLLSREALAPAWRDLLLVLRRMEARGEIRGGRFIDGHMGEQFALPEAVELLRAERKKQATNEKIILSAADPLNLVGIIVPGERVSPAATRTIVLEDGVPVVREATPTVLPFRPVPPRQQVSSR